ncbi:MAG: hypothetical protein UT48_C0001G0052 [Parcubacteria group bacterium GW2011_GWE2_39_37]|uniref:beta-fructofuranosidase n=1 Tax=Candidatus Falkowbacteria bacterium GW2011_GWF2_39_8 TaxID=1618642 RepID=A0A0G0T7H6_9BACT|nr:MAG: hypothetical protein UT48_C0001G0052 [Parcubacteria group bacterium GW2011_GWE2_39_37]KKR33797.1 MAG: hypothetical protein UT64_C0003G0018 [Candidatus Falkowbacteria bacterium GW2011_GWF2_39_8]
MKNNLLQEASDKAIELLLNNSVLNGILASSKSKQAISRSYLNVFGRDASICSFGMVMSGNAKLIETAKQSLLLLSAYQADNGQIPNYIKMQKRDADFWYLGCIDATLWWLLAIKFFDHHSNTKNKLSLILKKEIKKALNWLACQEHPKFYLLVQNEASDWADIMPRSGFVLYTNSLWYWVKEKYGLEKIKETKESFNYLFYPWQEVPQKYLNRNHRAKRLINAAKEKIAAQENFLSYANYLFFGEEVDVYANLLAIISGVADKKIEKLIINSFLKNKVNQPWPVKTVLKPIKENSKNWREYMRLNSQNFPNQYHNGGIWPFVGEFWVIALIKTGNKTIAAQEISRLAELNSKGDWQFNEWFHGKSGKAAGMEGQSWNAAMYILALQLLNNKKINL